MPTRSYTSRREAEQYQFSALTTLGVPLILLAVQAILPRVFPRLLILDLPLIAVIFFAVARRSPVSGAVTGALIGLLQDALTGQPIGIFGIAKTVVGYAAASIGLKVDVENITTRILMNFGFCLLQSLLVLIIDRLLLGAPVFHRFWLHEVLRAFLNTLVAIPLFLLLDRTRRRE